MALKFNEIRNRITANDQTRTAFQSAGRNATKYGKTTSGAAARVTKAFTAVNIAIAAATGLAARAALQAAEDAAVYEQSLMALDSQVQKLGITGVQAMDELRAASAGLLDDKSLVEAANRAISLGIGYEKLGGFMDIARAKSRDMGTTLSDAFADLTKALGRSSPLILDNLGIIVQAGEANKIYAESIGKTVSQLTEQEKKLAFQEAALDAGREALDRHDLAQKTNAEKMQTLKVSATNLARELGGLLSPAIVAVAEDLTSLIATMTEFATSLPTNIAAATESLKETTQENVINPLSDMLTKIEELVAPADELLNRLIPGREEFGRRLRREGLGEVISENLFGEDFQPPVPVTPTGDPRVKQEEITQKEILRLQRERMLASLEADKQLMGNLDLITQDQQLRREEALVISLETEKAFDANLELIHQDQVARKQKEMDLEKASADARRTQINAALGNLAEAARASNASFETQKKISIAQALVGTYQATVDAYKSAGNPYLGVVLAAAAFAANIAQVNRIRKTKPGSTGAGGTTTGGGLSSPTAATAPAAPLVQQTQQPQFNLTLQLEGEFNPDMIAAKLVPSLNKFGARGTFPNVQIQGAE